MKGRNLVLLVVVVVVAAVFGIIAKGRAERRKEAQRIFDAYVQATGGRQVYESIQSLAVIGHGTLMGKPVNIVAYHSAPDKYASYVGFTSREDDLEPYITGTDGKAAWRISEGRPEVLIGSRKLDVFREAAIDRDIRWRDFFSSIECEGTTEFGGKTCYKVVCTPHEGKPRTRYYDTQSYYLVAEESMPHVPGRQPEKVTETYENYRKVGGGLLMPSKIVARVGTLNMTATVDSVQVNPQIPDEQYAPPQAIRILLVGLPGYMK